MVFPKTQSWQGWEHAVHSDHRHQALGTVGVNGEPWGTAIPPPVPALPAPQDTAFSHLALSRVHTWARQVCASELALGAGAGRGTQTERAARSHRALHTHPSPSASPSPFPHLQPLRSQSPSPLSSTSSPCSLTHSRHAQGSCGLSPMGK